MNVLENTYGESLNKLRKYYSDSELRQQNIMESWRIKNTLNKGDKISYCGYEGSVHDMIEWCTGSVEIYLRSGITCVSVHDVKKI